MEITDILSHAWFGFIFFVEKGLSFHTEGDMLSVMLPRSGNVQGRVQVFLSVSAGNYSQAPALI